MSDISEYYTVVYKVTGGADVHNKWWQAIQPLFLADTDPVSVSAISKSDEMTRLDKIREIAERFGVDCHAMIDEIREALDVL